MTLRRLRLPGSLSQLAGSETAKAAGLAGAMIVNNVIALAATIIFARLLHDNQGGGYGSLAALVSYFLILSVVGQALQVATAREGVLGHLGEGHELADTVRRWSRSLIAFTILLALISVALRVQIASLVGVGGDEWGGRARPPRRRAVDVAVGPARRAAGDRGLCGRGRVADRGAGGAAGRRGDPRRRGRGRARRLRRRPDRVHRDVRPVPVADTPPRRGGERRVLPGRARGHRRGEATVGPRAPGMGADRRPDHRRAAAEHRHHLGQAPLLDV